MYIVHKFHSPESSLSTVINDQQLGWPRKAKPCTAAWRGQDSHMQFYLYLYILQKGRTLHWHLSQEPMLTDCFYPHACFALSQANTISFPSHSALTLISWLLLLQCELQCCCEIISLTPLSSSYTRGALSLHQMRPFFQVFSDSQQENPSHKR